MPLVRWLAMVSIALAVAACGGSDSEAPQSLGALAGDADPPRLAPSRTSGPSLLPMKTSSAA